MADGASVFWENRWGRTYRSQGYAEKLRIAQIKEGRFQGITVDVGAGANPVTRLLDTTRTTIIQIDQVSDEESAYNTLRVRLDIKKALDGSPEIQMAWSKVGEFLGLGDLDANKPQALFDDVVMSRLLAYVDYKSTIKLFRDLLKPGGVLHINHNFLTTKAIKLMSQKYPELGNILPENGLKSRDELEVFLRNLGLSVSVESAIGHQISLIAQAR